MPRADHRLVGTVVSLLGPGVSFGWDVLRLAGNDDSMLWIVGRLAWDFDGFSRLGKNDLHAGFCGAIPWVMNTPDEHAKPDDESEPSEDEMLLDFEELRKLVAKRPEDADEMKLISKVEIGFFEKHRRRLEELGLAVGDILADLIQVRDKHDESCRDVEATQEAYLQSVANLADHKTGLNVAVIQAMHEIHAVWEDLDYQARESFNELLEEYKEQREGFLAALPLDERRRLEELYPQWW